MIYLLVTPSQNSEIERINTSQRPVVRIIQPMETQDGLLLLNADLLNDCEFNGSTWFLWEKVLKNLSEYSGKIIWKESIDG